MRLRNRSRSVPPESGAGGYLRRPGRPATQKFLGVLVGAAVIFALLSLVLGDRGVAQLWELAWRQRELRTELTALERDAENLRWELGETGTMAVERPAREKFQMQRPGEIVYYFPRTGTSGAEVTGFRTGSERPADPSDDGREATGSPGKDGGDRR